MMTFKSFLKKYIFNSDVFFSMCTSYTAVYILTNKIKLSFFKSSFYQDNQNTCLAILYILLFFIAFAIWHSLKEENLSTNPYKIWLRKYIFNSYTFPCMIASYFWINVFKNKIQLSFFESTFYQENQNICLTILYIALFLLHYLLSMYLKKSDNLTNGQLRKISHQ